MNEARVITDLRKVRSLPTRAVRRCVLVGEFICCGEGRSALVLPRGGGIPAGGPVRGSAPAQSPVADRASEADRAGRPRVPDRGGHAW